MNSQDYLEEMTAPRFVALRKAMDDKEIAAKYGRYYREVGPAHLSPEICAAIERDLERRRKA